MNKHQHISNLSLHISSHQSSLTAMEKDMIQKIMKCRDQFNFQNFTIAHISESLNVSSTSLHRLSKKLGYSSFALFKEDYFNEPQLVSNEDSTKDYAMTLSNTYRLAEQSITNEMIDAIFKAKRITIYGMGMSSYIGKMFQVKLQLMGIYAQQHDDSRFMRISAMNLKQDEDVIIVMSRSGRPPELIEVLVEANKRHVTSILITEMHNSPLESMASFVIYTASVNDYDDAIDTRVNTHIAIDLLIEKCIRKKRRNEK